MDGGDGGAGGGAELHCTRTVMATANIAMVPVVALVTRLRKVVMVFIFPRISLRLSASAKPLVRVYA